MFADARAELPQLFSVRSEELYERRDEALSWARAQARTARYRGEVVLWETNATAVNGARKLVDTAAMQPPLQPVVDPARELVDRWEAATMLAPVADYTALNVKGVLSAMDDLGHLGLRRVRHHETITKARKTVLKAVEQKLERLAR